MYSPFFLLDPQSFAHRGLLYIICGGFNARCGELNTDKDGIPPRKVTDVVKNSQSEAFVDFLRSTSITEVNGRKGRDAFTRVSGKGCLVVDYCLVSREDFHIIENFKVTTMSESMEEMDCRGVVTRTPDHSLMNWPQGCCN